MTPEERFAANLRRYRKAARLTQEQLAAKASSGVTREILRDLGQ